VTQFPYENKPSFARVIVVSSIDRLRFYAKCSNSGTQRRVNEQRNNRSLKAISFNRATTTALYKRIPCYDRSRGLPVSSETRRVLTSVRGTGSGSNDRVCTRGYITYLDRQRASVSVYRSTRRLLEKPSRCVSPGHAPVLRRIWQTGVGRIIFFFAEPLISFYSERHTRIIM